MNLQMEIFDLESKLHETLQKYKDLSKTPVDGWKIKILEPSSKVLGNCNYPNRTIGISRILIEHGTKDEILDTLNHEIAHVLAGIEYKNSRFVGHGATWRKFAVMLGATPRATTKVSDKVNQKIVGISKYAVVVDRGTRFEIVSAANKKIQDLSKRFIPGQSETLGKLYMVDSEIMNSESDYQKIQKFIFR